MISLLLIMLVLLLWAGMIWAWEREQKDVLFACGCGFVLLIVYILARSAAST